MILNVLKIIDAIFAVMMVYCATTFDFGDRKFGTALFFAALFAANAFAIHVV